MQDQIIGMAVIVNGVVENIIAARTDFVIPGKTLVLIGEAFVEPGYLWDGQSFSAPPIDPNQE